MVPPASAEEEAAAGGRLSRLPIPAPLARLLRSDFAQKVAETFGTRIVLIAVNVVNTILIARILGPEGRGQYAVALAVAMIGSQVLTLGLQSAGTYFVAKDRTQLGRLISNALAFTAFVALVALASIALVAIAPGLSPVPLGLTALAIASVPFALLTLNLRHLLLGIGEVRSYNVVDLVAGVTGAAMTLTLALAGAATPASLLGVVVAMALIGVAISGWRIRAYFDRLPRPSGELFKRCAAFGFRIYLATGFALIMLKSDLIVIQFIDGSEASGLYSIASSITDLLWVLPSVVGAILFPRLAALPDTGERWRVTLRTLAGTLAVFVPILALAALTAPIAITVLFGSEFEPSAPSLRILCAAALFYGASAIFSQFLAARGFPWVTVVIWAFGFGLNLLLNILLIPPMGIEGAALASLFAYAAAFLGIVATSIHYARADERANLAA